MGVLTAVEYEELQKNKKNIAEAKSGDKEIKKSESPAQPTEEIKRNYIFGFPEIPQNGTRPSFLKNISIDDKEYTFSCVEGIIITQNEGLAKYFKNKGYIHLETKEVKNNEIQS